MSWGKAQEVLGLIRQQVRGPLQPEILTAVDEDQQAKLNLTPAQRAQLQALLTDLDIGTATTLQHQRATARLIRASLRL